MMDALWCPDGCKSFGWFCGQFFSPTCGITQCLLRKKVLNNDMTKYSCFQGEFNHLLFSKIFFKKVTKKL